MLAVKISDSSANLLEGCIWLFYINEYSMYRDSQLCLCNNVSINCYQVCIFSCIALVTSCRVKCMFLIAGQFSFPNM